MDADSVRFGGLAVGVRNVVQCGKYRLNGLFRSKFRGVDGEAGEAEIVRTAPREAFLGRCRVDEDRTGDLLEHAAVEEDREGSIEEDCECIRGLLDEEPIGDLFGSAAAESKDCAGASQGRGERGGFEPTKVSLAVPSKELRDR